MDDSMDNAGDIRPAPAADVIVVVVTGGDAPDRAVVATIPDGARVVAADSGADTALALGLVVHEIVGDLDSVSETGLKALKNAGATVEAHQPDKDATDLDLALAAALRHAPTRILVLGGLGGRTDHALANLLLLSGTALAGVDVTLRSGRCTAHVVRPGRPATITGSAGDLVSLLPLHGPAGQVSTDGLRWALHDADLVAGTTVGISNELIDERATVTCAEGVVLVVQPGLQAAVVPPRTPPTPSIEVSHDR